MIHTFLWTERSARKKGIPINFFVVFHERERSRRSRRRRRRLAWPSSQRGNVLAIRKRKLERKRRRRKRKRKAVSWSAARKIGRRVARTVINFARWTVKDVLGFSFEYELRQLGSPLFPARLFVRWLARIAGHYVRALRSPRRFNSDPRSGQNLEGWPRSLFPAW